MDTIIGQHTLKYAINTGQTHPSGNSEISDLALEGSVAIL
jgi:hypothetical protein